MQNNFLIAINKPTGLTSSDVVVKVRHILSNYFNSKVKVGHMGTLDPGAAGLLLVGVNKATRLFDLLLSKNKSYIGRLSFGKDTDTLDSYGKEVYSVPTISHRLRLRDFFTLCRCSQTHRSKAH